MDRKLEPVFLEDLERDFLQFVLENHAELLTGLIKRSRDKTVISALVKERDNSYRLYRKVHR